MEVYGSKQLTESGEKLIYGWAWSKSWRLETTCLRKKYVLHRNTWVKRVYGTVVERAMMDFVLISR